MNPTRKPSNADLQLRQSFRWVLLSPSLEPISGLLSRHLRHGLTQLPRDGGMKKAETLRRVVKWLPRVWELVNKAVSQSAGIGQSSFLMHSVVTVGIHAYSHTKSLNTIKSMTSSMLNC